MRANWVYRAIGAAEKLRLTTTTINTGKITLTTTTTNYGKIATHQHQDQLTPTRNFLQRVLIRFDGEAEEWALCRVTCFAEIVVVETDQVVADGGPQIVA